MNILFRFALLWCVCFQTNAEPSDSSHLRIGVVDVQQCINQYWKTSIEVEKVNALVKDYRNQLENTGPDGAAMLQKQAQEAIAEARLTMEKVLLTDLNNLIVKVADRHRFDLVLDKSLLPKGGKMTFYVSDEVPNLTTSVMAEAKAVREGNSTLDDVDEITVPKLRLGTIDIQTSLNKYWRTQVEVEKIKKRSQELAESMESLSPKAAEHAKIRVAAEILKLRQEMEMSLMSDLQLTVRQIAEAGDFAIIFDASFIPKGRKGLIFANPEVPDFTTQTIEITNSTRKGGDQLKPDPAAFPKTAGFGLKAGIVDLDKARENGFNANPEIIKSRSLLKFKDEAIDLVFDATFISDRQKFVLVRSNNIRDLTELFSPSDN